MVVKIAKHQTLAGNGNANGQRYLSPGSRNDAVRVAHVYRGDGSSDAQRIARALHSLRVRVFGAPEIICRRREHVRPPGWRC